MANVAVIGAQWGDEGKGKMVDWLSERADIVVRYQGGHNAGHTLVIDGKEFKLSILPSGTVRSGKLSIIGNGVVLEPFNFLSEIKNLQKQGVNVSSKNLLLSETATLILPIHSHVDRARELQSGANKIGTTGRGIGPAYEDKIARRALRIVDLSDKDVLEKKLEQIINWHNIFLKELGQEISSFQSHLKQLTPIIPDILSYTGKSWRVIADASKNGKRILFEGAQGVMLDIDHGTYPFVTSSNTVAAQAATGSGTGPSNVHFVLGITKAYTTRVGEGPFPTEDLGENGKKMGEKGREFGTVTGRKRRCGWFDAVMVRQAGIMAGINGMALTKLDVLDGFDILKICIGYKVNGKEIDYFPSDIKLQIACKPIFEEMPGWDETTYGARSWTELPPNAVKYIRRLEELTQIPLALLSTGPEREDTILITDPFVRS